MRILLAIFVLVASSQAQLIAMGKTIAASGPPITHAKSGAGFCTSVSSGGMGTGAGTMTTVCTSAQASAVFTYTASAAAVGQMVMFMGGSGVASTTNVMTLACTSGCGAGWTINTIACTGATSCTSGTFGTSGNRAVGFWALVPNTTAATFTLSNGTGTTQFFSILIDEFAAANATTPIDSSKAFAGTGCTSTVTPTNDNEAIWWGCVDSVTAVGAPFTKGGDDTQQDVAEYRILTTSTAGVAQSSHPGNGVNGCSGATCGFTSSGTAEAFGVAIKQ